MGPNSELELRNWVPIAGMILQLDLWKLDRIEEGKRLRRPHPPLARCGAPVCPRTQFRKKEKRKRSEAECFLSRAVGSLGRFQPQAAVLISGCSSAGAHTLARSPYPGSAGKRVIEKRGRKVLFIAVIQAIDKRGERGRLFP